MATCPVQWRTVRKGGRELTHNSRAGIPKRTLPNCQKKYSHKHTLEGRDPKTLERVVQLTERIVGLEPAWTAAIRKGAGAKDPLYEGQGPENPGVVAPFLVAGWTVDEVRPTSLPSSSTVVTVLWRCLQFLDKFDTAVTPARCRVFFDKVDDVPVVLCNGVPQVQSVSLSSQQPENRPEQFQSSLSF